MDSLILFCIIGLFGFVFFLINIFTLLNHSALTDMITAEPVALILIIVVYIIDIFLIKELIPSIKKSFGLALKGFQKRFMKRDKLLSADDEKIIARLRELKKVDLNDGKVYRTLHFCQLVQNLENSDCAKECYFEAMCRKETLDEVKQCENILLETAKECKQKGRIEQANQILQEISENNLLFDRDSWNREYEVYEQNVATETEALTNWSFGIVLIIGISILLFTISAS